VLHAQLKFGAVGIEPGDGDFSGRLEMTDRDFTRHLPLPDRHDDLAVLAQEEAIDLGLRT
jgi:hypothetical protein